MMSYSSHSRTQNRLNAINFLFIASAVISVIGAWEIAKGATLNRLNFLHLKNITRLAEATDTFTVDSDPKVLEEIILDIRQQPVACLKMIGPAEKLAMRAAGTFRAYELCHKDIADVDRVLAKLAAYEHGAISHPQLTSAFATAREDFTSNSNEFEPLVDKTVRLVLISVIALIAVKGVAIAFFGWVLSRRISENFSLLDEATRKSQKSEERLNMALEGSTDGIWEWDLVTGAVKASHYFFESIGIEDPGSSDLGAWLGAHGHPDDLPAVQASWLAHLNHGAIHDVNCRIRNNQGAWQWIRIRGHVREDEAGNPVRALGTLSNVNALVEAQIQAELANRSQSEFLATMSHEIRTPMNGVLGMLNIMLQGDINAAERDKAIVARDSAESLLTILNDILDYSRLDAGQVELEKLPFNPERVGAAVIELLNSKAEEKGLRLSYEAAENLPPWVELDPTRVRQVLINLVSNAIKFTQEGNVDLRTSYRKGSDNHGLIRFEIKDTGIGIAEEAQGRLFNRFSQVDSSMTRRFGGAGLGLAISKQLVERMGGEIGFESTHGAGSLFWFTLPVVVAMQPPAEAKEHTTDDRSIGKLRVLAAEDQPVNQQVLRAFLTSDGHDVVLVEDGAKALAAVQQSEFDVVLMDIQMPNMDGFEATRAIRALGDPLSTIPIVALTANAMAGDEERCLKNGMDGYVSKPFNADTLNRAMAAAIIHALNAEPSLGEAPHAAQV